MGQSDPATVSGRKLNALRRVSAQTPRLPEPPSRFAQMVVELALVPALLRGVR